MSELYDKELLDKDVIMHQMKDRCNERTYEYHTELLTLLDMKVNGARGEDSISKQYSIVIEKFGSIVAIQNNIIRLSFDIAKETLQRAFELSGLEVSEDGAIKKV